MVESQILNGNVFVRERKHSPCHFPKGRFFLRSVIGETSKRQVFHFTSHKTDICCPENVFLPSSSFGGCMYFALGGLRIKLVIITDALSNAIMYILLWERLEQNSKTQYYASVSYSVIQASAFKLSLHLPLPALDLSPWKHCCRGLLAERKAWCWIWCCSAQSLPLWFR